MTDALNLDNLTPRQRADLAIAFCKRIRGELDDVICELMTLQEQYEQAIASVPAIRALRSDYEYIQKRARRLKSELDDWSGLAEESVLFASRTHDKREVADVAYRRLKLCDDGAGDRCMNTDVLSAIRMREDFAVHEDVTAVDTEYGED